MADLSGMKMKALLLAPQILFVVSCDTMNQSFSDSGFDPLRPPGAGMKSDLNITNGFKPGDFVMAIGNNTTFYLKKPKENASADKLLSQGTPMKVVSVSAEYLKVELDSGEVGFVPSIMISANSSNELLPVEGIDGIHPPIPNGNEAEPLPILDLENLPPSQSIPAIIDPSTALDLSTPKLDVLPDIKSTDQAKPSDQIKPDKKKGE